MKQKLKQFTKLMAVCAFLMLSSCEKDLYDEITIEKFQPKTNYVSIEQVPFLIPKIQEFNHDYDYLSSPNKLNNKETLNLNLDLDKILEYVYANGMKSYSLIIKKAFQENDDKYFENLHIYEKDGEYQTLIFKYNPIDDSKKFDFETFTGRVEMFDLDYNLVGIVDYESGSKVCIKIVIGCLHIWDFGHGNIWIWGTLECSDNPTGKDNTDNSGGAGGPSEGGSGSGGPTSSGSGPGGGSSEFGTGGNGGVVGLHPNAPSQYDQFVTNLEPFTNNFKDLDLSVQEVISNYIIKNSNHFISAPARNFLLSIFSNPIKNNWFANATIESQISILNHVCYNNFSPESVSFVNEMINLSISNNSTFTFDNSATASNSQVFNTMTEYQNYLSNFNNDFSPQLSFSNGVGDKKIANFTFTVNLFTNFNVEIQQKLNPWSLEGITSSISGNTFSLSYNQLTSSDGGDITTSGNVKTIKFSGDLNVNVFIEGIGTIRTYHITFIVKVDTTTGQPISGQMIGF